MVKVERIRNAASLKGVKLGKICEILGEKSNYLGKVERGLRRMDENQIRTVADFLGCDYEYLTGESNYLYQRSYNGFEERKAEYDAALRKLHADFAKRYQPHFDYDRFNERRIARHLTPDYIEAQLGLPEDYWEDVRDGYRDTDEQTINRLAVLLETTYDYLMGLTDDPRIPSDDRTGVKIGVFGDVAAGIPIKQIDNFDPEDPDSWEEIDRWTAKSGLYFALKIKGDSMSPRILEGDVVIVRKQPMVESNQLAVVAINGDTATCKKVVWDENGGMFLMSLNPAYPPKYFSAEEVRTKPVTILGKVVEFRAKTI